MTVAEFASRWADLSTTRSPETQRHAEQMVARFVHDYADLPLGEMVPVDAQMWAGRHPGQVKYLRAFFADAVRLGLCAENPFSAVRGASGRKMDRTPPDGPMLARITAAANPCFRDVITVAAYTGLRLSELAAVERRDVIRVPSLRIVVRNGKGGRSTDQASVLGPAFDVIRDLCEYRVGPLFTTPEARLWTRESVSRRWRAACAEVGFGSTFHCLRRYFATWLIDRGASYQDVAVAMRHFDADGRPNIELVARLYGHPSPTVALSRLEALA